MEQQEKLSFNKLPEDDKEEFHKLMRNCMNNALSKLEETPPMIFKFQNTQKNDCKNFIKTFWENEMSNNIKNHEFSNNNTYSSDQFDDNFFNDVFEYNWEKEDHTDGFKYHEAFRQRLDFNLREIERQQQQEKLEIIKEQQAKHKQEEFMEEHQQSSELIEEEQDINEISNIIRANCRLKTIINNLPDKEQHTIKKNKQHKL